MMIRKFENFEWDSQLLSTSSTICFYAFNKALHLPNKLKRSLFVRIILEALRADEKMLKTGKLEGAHYAAMREILEDEN